MEKHLPASPLNRLILIFWAMLFTFAPPNLFAGQKSLPLATLELPPCNYLKDGKPVGASVEFVRELFARMGYETTIRIMPFKRGKKATAEGKYAGLFTIVKSPERLKHYYYPNPITVNKNVFFKRKEDDLSWDTMEDLKDYRLGLSEGYSLPPILQAAIDMKIFRSIDTLSSQTPALLQLRKLAKKRIDFFMTEMGEGIFYKKQFAPEFDSIDFNPKPVGPVKNWYFVFSKRWPKARQLVRQFNVELEKMISEGRQKTIYGKYGIFWEKTDDIKDW